MSKTTTTDAMRNAFNQKKPTAVQQLTQGTESAAQEEPKRRGPKPKKTTDETTRATFIVKDPELWENFKLYAEVLGEGTTATDLLLQFMKETVDANIEGITAYKEAKEAARQAFLKAKGKE